MTSGTLHRAVASFVDALAHAGVRHVCACPGSRSTPLVIELARQPEVKLWMHLDERSAAYFGLGLARACRQPVALLATSGTAAANFFPAVVEANLARVPLVVLTADRPHELRDNGAPQSIDQLRLFGQHAKWFFDLPEPDASTDQLALLRALAARGVATALAEPSGPVQLNWPLREPLIPATDGGRDPGPQLSVHPGRLGPTEHTVAEVAAACSSARRGLIVVGPQDDAKLPSAVAELARHTGFPILGDALSGLRRGPHDARLVIDAYDAFLRAPAISAALAPDLVLRLGALPTSKPLQQFVAACPGRRHMVVDPGGWRDPTGLATDVLHVDPTLLCKALVAELSQTPPRQGWASEWRQINELAREAIRHQLGHVDGLSEPRIASELGSLLPDGAVLYAGNSMPVRDLETFLGRSDSSLRCLANRGANGIDGVVSSALGAAASRVGPTALLIGDVSFYHDLNGLFAARKHGLSLLVVLVNNDGGGIFSFLPQAELDAEQFEWLFGTPHGLDFRSLVSGYGGTFVRVRGVTEFRSAVSDGLNEGGLRVVEVPTDRAQNVLDHRAVWRAVAEALQPAAVA